jgi:hypothetical protein
MTLRYTFFPLWRRSSIPKRTIIGTITRQGGLKATREIISGENLAEAIQEKRRNREHRSKHPIHR